MLKENQWDFALAKIAVGVLDSVVSRHSFG